MERNEVRWAVVARIPDLNAGRGEDETARKAWLPASTGRLIGQAMSFKVLAGIALLLVIGAVAPFAFNRKAPPTDTSLADAATTWHTETPAAPAAVPTLESKALQPTAPTRPVAIIPASQEHVSAPAVLPAPPEKRTASVPAVDATRMSAWPNPAVSGTNTTNESTQATANGSAAARSPAYEADARAGSRPQQSTNPVK